MVARRWEVPNIGEWQHSPGGAGREGLVGCQGRENGVQAGVVGQRSVMGGSYFG